MEGEFDSDDHDHEEEEMVEEEEDEAVVDEAGSNNVDSEAEISEPVFEQHVEAESVDQGQSDNEGLNEATSDAGDVETAVELVNVGQSLLSCSFFLASTMFRQIFSLQSSRIGETLGPSSMRPGRDSWETPIGKILVI